MLASVKKEIAVAIKSAVSALYHVDLDIVLEVPPQRALGDLACPVAFTLAKSLHRKPREIAQEVRNHLSLPGVARIEVAGAGYVNLFLRRRTFVHDLYLALRARVWEDYQGKTIVEHTNINPNKAAHIGHLRNAVLGDTLVRILRTLGYSVEVQNYIDDTGVQVADVVVGFTELEKKTLDEIKAIPDPFDYYCWDLYARVGRWYEEDPSREALRLRVLHEIEAGDTDAARVAACVADRIVHAHLATMERLGIRYDLLPHESDILRGAFWQAAFDMLKAKRAVRLEDDGKNKGCWVMDLSAAKGFEEMDDPDKILVRSNGTVTYTGKDVAYQLWKFGLLGKDFRYEPFKKYDDDRTLWTTTTGKADPAAPAFGKAARVYNVIDVRQSYPQKVVKHALAVLGFAREAEQSVHFSYEMVALSQAAAKPMGVADEEGGVVGMSGRKGIGVKADDFLNAVLDRARGAVADEKADEMDDNERDRVAQLVALAAVRYLMIKYGRNRVIAFDFDEALNLRGETGPYLLYSLVRFGSIFRKLRKAGLWTDEDEAIDDILWRFATDLTDDDWDRLDLEDWDLLLEVGRFEEVLQASVADLELSYLAKFAFSLAQKANAFYHRCHILSEPDPARQRVLMAVSCVFRYALGRLLDLMGIETLGRM
ncbi:MAG: arginine--tRNA ligase [Planctomycetota bacterium]